MIPISRMKSQKASPIISSLGQCQQYGMFMSTEQSTYIHDNGWNQGRMNWDIEPSPFILSYWLLQIHMQDFIWQLLRVRRRIIGEYLLFN